ncbi:P2Y purinoceptor 14-like [Lates calcarifer]|uniref:P2Y purinoceptor 14-like n=1 Tax=Lates calcarifer TaxID=8187 RepID=A0AAJ8DJY2_LATCA|nr:P2Y purinoceptor 14-like [Lates calcarifer]
MKLTLADEICKQQFQPETLTVTGEKVLLFTPVCDEGPIVPAFSMFPLQVGLLLNSFTMKFYFCRGQQRSSSSMMVYLKNLAAADFLFCLCLPLRIAKYSNCSITIHQIFCSFGASAFYLNMYASILFMGYIAANRYLKIVHPSQTHILQTKRSAHIISTVTWVCLLALMITFITLLLLTQEPLTSVPDKCDVLYSPMTILLFKIIHICSTTVFLFVLISLVFFYYNSSRKVLLAQQRQPTSSDSKKLVKSRRNMLVLVSVFCVCFVPYHLVRLPYTFLWRRWSVNQVFRYLQEVTITVSVLNICLDPLIYFFLCTAFRNQLNPRKVFNTVRVNMQTPNSETRSSTENLSTIGINSANNSQQHK